MQPNPNEPIERQDNVVIKMPTLAAMSKCVYQTSLDDTTDQGKAIVFKAMQTSDLKGSEVGDSEFAIRDVLFHPVDLEDEQTGELQEAIRTVFIDKDGTTVAFVSVGILQAVRHLASLYGPPPWVPTLIVRVAEKQTGKKRRYYTLEVCGRRD